jgi:hypothetical protein
VGIFGALAILALVVTHIHLSRRHHRFLNPAVLGTTLAMAALVGLSLGLLSNEAEHLRVAKKDAFDSIFALTQARAVSYDANADESRYLLDPDRAAQYEQAFLGKSQKLVGFADVGIAQYNDALKAAIAAYGAHHDDVGFTGSFGTGLRNITFSGERAAAERTITAYQVYQQADVHIRELLTGRNLEEAIRFSTSVNPGDSNYAFNQYGDALNAWIRVNQTAFDDTIRAGEQELGGWAFIPGIGALLAIALLLMGIRPRLAEYR